MRTVLVDTNLLVLLVVGLADPKLIEKHKRTQAFSSDDFMLFGLFLERYEQIVVTPGILAETSNLLRQTGEPARSALLAQLMVLIDGAAEVHITGRTAAACPRFLQLGLTDCSILEATKAAEHLVTVDLDLYVEAARTGLPVTNFNHLRQEHLLS
ncbi:hypothetical protein [Luteolibacter soli]|uniref:PIN domain-containing protein n=1 Tax=Luteolibacter soli TaxID=3135280 RepID=A0ABU9AQ14_9BACT